MVGLQFRVNFLAAEIVCENCELLVLIFLRVSPVTKERVVISAQLLFRNDS